jgi:two-component system chemotaxis response regulator CheB
MKKIKVLIVDDSAVMRRALLTMLSFDPLIEVIGMAGNPFAAVAIIKNDVPDVITLDIEMPGMDGLTFLQKIMAQYPIPVVIITNISGKNAGITVKAKEYGAVDVLAKPLYLTNESIEESKTAFCEAVSAASKKSTRNIPPTKINRPPGKIIVIGASSGGTIALEVLLKKMTCGTYGIVIVQHMKEYFTKLFAHRLNELCEISVKEAEQNDKVIKGRALIAPGDKHILLRKTGNEFFVDLRDGALVSRHRPSVDILFQSAAESAGKDAIGIILTGMGSDGAKGLLKMKQAGAMTIAQDESTCAVFGMPKEAIALNAVSKILPLHGIADYIRADSRPEATHCLNITGVTPTGPYQ